MLQSSCSKALVVKLKILFLKEGNKNVIAFVFTKLFTSFTLIVCEEQGFLTFTLQFTSFWVFFYLKGKKKGKYKILGTLEVPFEFIVIKTPREDTGLI